jgi:transcriptional regulator of acetoin/glycerol metabolism
VLPLLERTQHNVSKAARLAGIDRIYRMMKKHGIARKE